MSFLYKLPLWVIPCQTTGKKLEPQKNVILVLISFTYIQKCQIRSFISVVLELVCHFGQILSFEAFDIFFKDMSIFLNERCRITNHQRHAWIWPDYNHVCRAKPNRICDDIGKTWPSSIRTAIMASNQSWRKKISPIFML